jgi:oligopeptide transport system substrate-binding protein
MDPRKSGDFISSSLICLLYEGLTRCGPGEEIFPAAAKNIDISPDGKIYTFHLRKTIWTDGTPVTAFDFEKSWKKSIDPSFPSLSSYLFFPIKNVEKYIQGQAFLSEVGIEAVDASTLRVELERPTPYFLSLTAFPVYLPIPTHREEKDDKWDLTDSSDFVCNGPFRIQKMVPNNEIALIKNRSFWNKKTIRLNSIHISILSDETTALQMFERGELDFIGGPLSPLPPDALENLGKKGLLRFISMDASTFCTFNMQKFPFHNLSLRKAFCLAIDRDAILQEAAHTGQIPAVTLLPPAFVHTPRREVSFNAEKAREHLKQALQELQISAADLNQITLYYRQGQDKQRLAQTLQKSWKEILGVSLRIEQVDQKSHLQKLHKKDYQIAMTSWISQFHDPISLLDRFRFEANPKNYPGWENDLYSLFLEQASLCTQPNERDALLAQAETLFMNETPIAPLYHWTAPYIAHPKVKNIATTPTGGILFEQFYVQK